MGGVPSLLPPPRPPPRSTCWPVLGSTISMILRSRGLKACCEGADSGLWGCWGGNPCCTWVGCPKKTERDAKKDLNGVLFVFRFCHEKTEYVGCNEGLNLMECCLMPLLCHIQVLLRKKTVPRENHYLTSSQ